MNVSERVEVVGIRECSRCGESGDPDEEFGVDGVARMLGNLCLECVREIAATTENRTENQQ